MSLPSIPGLQPLTIMLTSVTDCAKYDYIYKTYKSLVDNWKSLDCPKNFHLNQHLQHSLSALAESENVMVLLVTKCDNPLNTQEIFKGYRHEMYFPKHDRSFPIPYSVECWCDHLKRFPDMVASCHKGCAPKFESAIRRMSTCINQVISNATNIRVIEMFKKSASREINFRSNEALYIQIG
ncbi:MAG: hypothetical protein LBI56_01615 [Puniceicoccales bacterium]|jgi:hypothetical protein|nr:hypothetical protein [Puniceicoccales bacterium]